MHNNKTKIFLFISLILSTSFCMAKTKNDLKHPFYVGAIGGYGATTWQGLVPTKENQNVALMLSTPIRVQEGGATWGGLAGYEFTPYFAIEANYMHYAEALVHFDSISLFTFLHNNLETLSTKTETISLMGKLMVPIPHREMKIFSSIGVAGIHRRDIAVDDWRPGPTFSAGVNFNLTERLMGEIAGNYTAGYGESQLSPVDAYFPFLYSLTVHLIYRL